MTIGNNCFIGYNSTVLKGVTIGDNVIIGANSVVTKDIPSNSVAVGNPARVIMNIEDYYKKRKEAQYKEAKELVLTYREVYGKNPSKKELSEFFWLFSNGKDDIEEFYDHMNHLVGYNELTINKFLNNEKMFNDFEEFLDSIK